MALEKCDGISICTGAVAGLRWIYREGVVMKYFEGKPVVHRYEQVQYFSEKEFQRRREVTRQVMREQDVGVLIFIDGYWEGYSQWLVGTRNAHYVILPMAGPALAVFDGKAEWFAFAEDAVDIPKDPGICAVHSVKAICLQDLLKEAKSNRLGFIHLEAMSLELHRYLKDTVPKAEWVDITEALDPVKATKSREELELIQASVEVHERVMGALPAIIRPGHTVMETDREMRHLCHELGSGNGECLSLTLQAGSGFHGAVPYREGFWPYPDRRLKEGDQISILLETNGPGGHFSAIGRHFSLGPPPEEDFHYWNLALKMQDFAAERLRPGISVKKIYDENEEYINRLGYRTVPRNYLHSLGYCFGEKPFLFDKTETIPLRENMVYIVHPYVAFTRKNLRGYEESDEMCAIDTYRVTPEGGIRQNKVPREIIIL